MMLQLVISNYTIPGRVPPKVLENGSKDLSAFLHEVRGPKSKFGSTAGFRAKNPKFFL